MLWFLYITWTWYNILKKNMFNLSVPKTYSNNLYFVHSVTYSKQYNQLMALPKVTTVATWHWEHLNFHIPVIAGYNCH